MKFSACCVTVFLMAQTAWPCANFTGGGTRYDGREADSPRAYGASRLRSAMTRDLRTEGKELEAKLQGSTNFNDRSDYSIALMYLGKNEEAVQLLEILESQRPGEYFIAANLGTAYELSGNNDKALEWINEGMRRNPDSHEGTEWLHAKILEAKIAQGHDENYFEKHSVLELGPAKIGGAILIDGKNLSPKKLAEAIEQFVKPPDAPVASLLFDYAAIEARTRSLEAAKKVLEIALKYGYPPAKIDPLVKEFDQKIDRRKLQRYALYSLIGVAIIGLLVLLYKRGIFVLSSEDLKKRL